MYIIFSRTLLNKPLSKLISLVMDVGFGFARFRDEVDFC